MSLETIDATLHRFHPARAAFAACGGVVFKTKGHAIRAYDESLRAHGFHLCMSDYMGVSVRLDEVGYREYLVLDDDSNIAGFATISWVATGEGFSFAGTVK